MSSVSLNPTRELSFVLPAEWPEDGGWSAAAGGGGGGMRKGCERHGAMRVVSENGWCCCRCCRCCCPGRSAQQLRCALAGAGALVIAPAARVGHREKETAPEDDFLMTVRQRFRWKHSTLGSSLIDSALVVVPTFWQLPPDTATVRAAASGAAGGGGGSASSGGAAVVDVCCFGCGGGGVWRVAAVRAAVGRQQQLAGGRGGSDLSHLYPSIASPDTNRCMHSSSVRIAFFALQRTAIGNSTPAQHSTAMTSLTPCGQPGVDGAFVFAVENAVCEDLNYY